MCVGVTSSTTTDSWLLQYRRTEAYCVVMIRTQCFSWLLCTSTAVVIMRDVHCRMWLCKTLEHSCCTPRSPSHGRYCVAWMV